MNEIWSLLLNPGGAMRVTSCARVLGTYCVPQLEHGSMGHHSPNTFWTVPCCFVVALTISLAWEWTTLPFLHHNFGQIQKMSVPWGWGLCSLLDIHHRARRRCSASLCQRNVRMKMVVSLASPLSEAFGLAACASPPARDLSWPPASLPTSATSGHPAFWFFLFC